MSYCRWSSMDWRCDLYVYEHVDGYWTIHVADYRRVGDVPEVDWALLREGKTDEFMAQYRAQMASLDDCKMVGIDLPFAGETFNLATPGECADKIEELMALGYVAPPEVVAELREEQKDGARREG